MLLFRAMSLDDMRNYHDQSKKYIFSSLYNSLAFKDPNRHVSNYLSEYNDLCFKQNRKYALDCIIGHISGKKLSVHSSPWVSTSKDFFYTLSEYAMPQAGNFNHETNRKPVIIINIPDQLVYDDFQSIKKLREEKNNNFAIDLTDDKLTEYYDNDAILAECYSEGMPGYVVPYPSEDEDSNIKTRVTGFSHFATSANEVLVFGGIRKDIISLVLYPLLADILYSCQFDFNRDYELLMEKKDAILFVLQSFYYNSNPIYSNRPYLYSLFNELYPTLESGINLTDYLVNHYQQLPGTCVERKYNELKLQKKELLEQIVNAINIYCKTDFKCKDIIDNKVLVINYRNINTISSKLLNDVILIEKDNNLYQYNHKNYRYIAHNNDFITKGEALQLIKKRPIR